MKRARCGPDERWSGCRVCWVRRRCRCRCSSGGRGPAERITLTPLGDEPVPLAEPNRPWPGQLPEPSPTVLLDDPVELLDAQGNSIRVTSRGLFSADPARLTARGRDDRLHWWAGPWPVDERWWDADDRHGAVAPPVCRCCWKASGRPTPVRRCCCATGRGGGIWRESTSEAARPAQRRTAPLDRRTGRRTRSDRRQRRSARWAFAPSAPSSR